MLVEQSQSESSAASGGSSEDVPLSAMEAFRRKYVKGAPQKEQTEAPSASPPSSPFASDWSSAVPEESPKPQTDPKALTLENLAAIYREQGISREYSTRKPKVTVQNRTPNKLVDMTSRRRDLRELIERDEKETPGDADIFGGENMRDYQGVLPLEGGEYMQEKFALKLGSLVESRGAR
jgi:hypothetical protein